MSPTWSGHAVDEQAATWWAGQITAGLATAATIRAIVSATRAAQGNGSTDPSMLAAFLTAQGSTGLLAGLLAHYLDGIYREGYAIGQRAATAAVNGTADTWEGWAPGNAADTPQAPALDALQHAAQDAAQDMADTRVQALAQALADAVRRGETADQITELIRHRLGDPADAYRIAITELVRAQSAATVAVYQHHGVQRHYWVTESSNVCPLCQENAQTGPVQVGMPFASGDAAPPIHPNDRCALLPVLERPNDAG